VATGAGAGLTIAVRLGNPVVVTAALLVAGSRLAEGVSDGSGMDCRTGMTAATVRGVRSLSASAGASMSCLGVRARVPSVPPTADAPDIARWAQASKTAAARAIRRVRYDFRRCERLVVVGSDARGSTSRGSGTRCG
jgi:hypothetical protein